jgi:membrane protein DedA with SNARE-associated domain
MNNLNNSLETLENIEAFEYIFEMLDLMIARFGALGIAVAMFAESAGVPFASAIVLLTAGTMILRGTVSFWSILLASTVGITLGSIFSYFLGMLGSIVGKKVKTSFFHHQIERYDQSIDDSPSRIAKLWRKYGNFSIFMAQLWGVTRTFISYPAGAMKMNIHLFIVYTFLGGALFSLAAILLSITLTSTVSLTLKMIKFLSGLSPWLIALPVGILLFLIYLYFHYFKAKKSSL